MSTLGCWQQWSLNSALCRPRIAFCNRMDATVAGCSLRSRVNSRLWPDPTDSQTHALTFYTFECICRSIGMKTEDRFDLPQGTLDLLIMRVVALGPIHGYATRLGCGHAGLQTADEDDFVDYVELGWFCPARFRDAATGGRPNIDAGGEFTRHRIGEPRSGRSASGQPGFCLPRTRFARS